MGFRVTQLSDPIDMNKQINPSSKASHVARLSTLACAIALAASGAASAFELGHSRVVSAPGQPLVVQVPINALTPDQAQSLSVSVAGASDWQAAGLTPPVALDSLSLNVQPGRNSDSRLVEIRSSQATQATVVDMLLAVRTDAASRTLQTSVIVPPAPQVRLAGQQITVQRGDTLSGIANQFPVQGANLYQQLWALYSANPRAFMNENMNLLRAGASLTIPDAETVRAVDPAFARAQYLEHVRAFRQMRGGGQGNQGVQAQASTQAAPSAPETQQGAVEQASEQSSDSAVTDQVKLTAAQSDQQTSEAGARAEETSRTETLEKNIDALQGALAQVQDATGAAEAAAGQAADSAQSAIESSAQQAEQAGAAAVDAATAAGQSALDQAQQALGSAESAAQAAGSAGETALDQAQRALDAAEKTAQEVASDTRDTVNQAAQRTASGAEAVSQNVFARLSQWVSDNLAATVLGLLALIALIIAWVLRKGRTAAAEGQQAKGRADAAADSFKEKLKDIDLSLDQKPDNKG